MFVRFRAAFLCVMNHGSMIKAEVLEANQGNYSYPSDGSLILAAVKLQVMSVDNTEMCPPPTAPVPRIQEEKRG
ncbi:uncharacterized [Tachysurus ichikawai]